MRPVDFKDAAHLGAPKDWDTERDGPCNSLPVQFAYGNFYSYWAPSWSDLFRLLIGWPLRLAVKGDQPPIDLEVVAEAGL